MLSKVFFITKMIDIVKREITITKSPHKPCYGYFSFSGNTGKNKNG